MLDIRQRQFNHAARRRRGVVDPAQEQPPFELPHARVARGRLAQMAFEALLFVQDPQR
jgi:hypothetical protein